MITTGALVFWLLLGALVCGLYIWVGIAGTRRRSGARTWPRYAALGLFVGLVGLVCGLLADSTGQAGLLDALGYLALVLGCPLLGAVAARRTGLVGSGALAAFWCALVSALLFALSTLAFDILCAQALSHGAWAHDPTCAMYGGDALTGCEISDDLGGRLGPDPHPAARRPAWRAGWGARRHHSPARPPCGRAASASVLAG
jgi:hypothetical protein